MAGEVDVVKGSAADGKSSGLKQLYVLNWRKIKKLLVGMVVKILWNPKNVYYLCIHKG